MKSANFCEIRENYLFLFLFLFQSTIQHDGDKDKENEMVNEPGTHIEGQLL